MSQGANRRADQINRAVLSVVGVAAVLGGGSALALSYTDRGGDDEHVLAPDQVVWLAAHGGVVAATVIVAGFVVAVLATQWLRRQLVPLPGAADLVVDRGPLGVSVLTTSALLDAVARDVERSDQVVHAHTALHARTPNVIEVYAEVSDRADLVQVGADIAEHVVPRARRASGRDDLELLVELSTIARPQRIAERVSG